MKKLLSREEELSKVFRYEWSPCNPVFYRPNLLIHSRRVEWISSEITKFLIEKTKKNIDIILVREMAKFHDDTEILTWDFLAMDKESFSKSKQDDYENDSINAISILYDNYWNISERENYKDILLNIESKKWLEFLIVDFADKLDAHLEITHELLAWNEAFNIKLTKWNIDLKPFNYTKNKLIKILPNILEYFKDDYNLEWSFLDLNSPVNTEKCLDNKKIHNLDNLRNKSWYNLYDLWIDLHFNYWNSSDIDYLINQIEFKK